MQKLVGLMVSLVFALSLSAAWAETQPEALVAAATERTEQRVAYDGRYVALDYPGGDVPLDIGVCTDLVIRSYRALGIDLQQLVHEDIRQNFEAYPARRIWGQTAPDTNIDHRRVPNLRVFFARHGQSLTLTDNTAHYRPGDLVTWSLPGNLPHIGIVSNRYSSSGVPLIIHNIGAGPVIDDIFFAYTRTGHYRYFPSND